MGRADATGGVALVVVPNVSRRDEFRPPVSATELAELGVVVNVLGFAEYAGQLSTTPGVRFVDLETIIGLFGEALPRITLETLPEDGRWFEPTGVLGGRGGTR